MIDPVDEVEIVVAHHERAAVRVGDVYLKIDGDPSNLDVEVERHAPLIAYEDSRVAWGAYDPEFYALEAEHLWLTARIGRLRHRLGEFDDWGIGCMVRTFGPMKQGQMMPK